MFDVVAEKSFLPKRAVKKFIGQTRGLSRYASVGDTAHSKQCGYRYEWRLFNFSFFTTEALRFMKFKNTFNFMVS